MSRASLEELLLGLGRLTRDDCVADDDDRDEVTSRCPGSGRRSAERDCSSVALFLTGEGGGGASRTTRWNIYENVNASDGLSGTYGKLRHCEENIYENICEDCGRLYGAGRCGFCAVEDAESDRDSVASSSRKFHRKYSAKFQEFLGNFRIRPKSVISPGKKKLSKSDIVHNVRGFEDVFRTNKSFDLGEICRMRDDEQVARLGVSGTVDPVEREGEGDEQLLNDEADEPALKVKSASANLIDGAIYENLISTNDDPLQIDDDAVHCWVTSLRSCVVEFDDDDVEYHVKSIPSVTFNDVGEFGGRAAKICEGDLGCGVEEFRLNWENNQRRRRFSGGKVEHCGDPVLITYGSVEFEEESSAGGTLTPGSVDGDRSEFVCGLLNLFEEVLSREKVGELEVISSYQTPLESLSLSKQSNSAVGERRSQRLQKYLLDVSLCRVVLTYERRLKVFLLVSSTRRRPSYRKFNKRVWYRLAMTSRSTDSTGSALQDSVRIDQYFQFLEANETMINRLEASRRRRRRKGQLLPNPDDVQSNSSSTSGVHSDPDSEPHTNIYQHIWTCKTEPSEPVYEECPAEHIYEYIRLDPPRDDPNWTLDNDFAFSKHRSPPPIPNRNIRHPLDKYRNVCILHNPADPRANRIVYDYRRDYIFDYRDSSSSETSSFCSSCVESASSSSDDDDEELDDGVAGKPATTTTVSYSIPDCVQYWKFMLLNVNYNDDEEDVIMTEKTIAVLADNVDPKPAATDSNVVAAPPPTPPVAIASQLHSPKFFGGPAVIRSPSKSQIAASDSPVGTYTSKSSENLATGLPPPQLDKEKSPTPKRERLRDKMKAVLPLGSSWSSSGGGQDDGLVFGVELDQVERDEKLQVPRFVAECVEILKEPEFIETSGLYRASGNKNSIEGIKKKLNEKRSPKKYEFLKKQDVHSLTGSLKLFFRELKSPLIPREVYEMCVQKTKDEAQTIENIKFSLERMELINRNTLRYLIRHLRCVHQNSDVNMMNSSNLAIVWGACLFASTLGLMESYENNDLGRINTLVRQLIDHYDKIFYSERRID